jgi:aerobic carbon-monoxide dehydrogenase small subunit
MQYARRRDPISRLRVIGHTIRPFRSGEWKGDPMTRVGVTVNGAHHEAEVEPRTLLVYFLRETLGLTGTNVGCDTSSCGSCTVLLDGELHALQQAFHEHHGLQCGFCTPGMILAAAGLIEEASGPLSEEEVRHGLEGNLCRCTGYQNIVKAVMAASEQMKAPVSTASTGSTPTA